MSKIKLLNRGDIILTKPANGYYGIAVVLSEKEKTPERHPQCHIAITPLIFDKEVNLEDLKPFEFDRVYQLKNIEEFTKKEVTIGVYTRRNKPNFKIIGNINPEIVYDGPLPFEPWDYLDITWSLYGDPDENLGRVAYINWKRKS